MPSTPKSAHAFQAVRSNCALLSRAIMSSLRAPRANSMAASWSFCCSSLNSGNVILDSEWDLRYDPLELAVLRHVEAIHHLDGDLHVGAEPFVELVDQVPGMP